MPLLWKSTVEPILQSESAECGLACLAMIANYHGKYITLSEMRGRHGVSNRGINLEGLMNIATALGFLPRPLRVDLEGLSLLSTPCILHWNLRHFVVLTRCGKNWAEIVDPAVGSIRLRMEEVSNHFTGIAVEMSLTQTFKTVKRVREFRLRDVLSRCVGLGGALTQVVLLTAVLQIIVMSFPIITQITVDQAIMIGDHSLITAIAVLSLCLVSLQAINIVARSYIIGRLSAGINMQFRGNLLHHLVSLPLSWFERRGVGDILSRFNSLSPLQEVISNGSVTFLFDGFVSITSVVIMVLYAPAILIFVVISRSVFFLIHLAIAEHVKILANEVIIHTSKSESIFFETIRSVRTFKLFNRETQRVNVWKNSFSKSVESERRKQLLISVDMAVSTWENGIERLFILAFGAYLISNHKFTVGMLMAFLSFYDQFVTAFTSFCDTVSKYKVVSLHVDRVGEVVSETPKIGNAIAHRTLDYGNCVAIELKDVWFRYGDHDPWVLKGINLKISPGQFVGLIGPSGQGKSTLLKVILGICPPTKGVILVNGENFDSQGLSIFRNLVGAVMQDDTLISGTIAENITFFDPEPDLERMLSVAKQVSLHKEIAKMPMSYNTLVAELGSSLSGGQQQRLFLARALYKNPRLLIMDEGTANLDPLTEGTIVTEVLRLSATRIASAHRHVALTGADAVIISKMVS